MESISSASQAPSDELLHQVDEVVAQVVRRRAAGELLIDEAVLLEQPGLAPLLRPRLEALQRARRALLDAQRAGATNEEFEPLSAEELDKPLILEEGINPAS